MGVPVTGEQRFQVAVTDALLRLATHLDRVGEAFGSIGDGFEQVTVHLKRSMDVAVMAASLDMPVEQLKEADGDLLALASMNRRIPPVNLYRQPRKEP